MQIHNLIQGSPEWLAYRAQMRNASDAPAMMGCSPYKTRAQLLRELHTGVVADVDIATQKRFDNGHRAEALARPLAEEIIGSELYPVTGSLGNLSASFDGLTLDELTAFEHKVLNDSLRAAFDATWRDSLEDPDAGRSLPLMHRVQMEQQLHVSGAERVLFMASAWTPDDELIEERHCWYYPDAELRAEIIRGWEQFELDLAVYTPPARAEPAQAEHMESLPAVAVRLDGALTVAGNLPSFAAALKAFIAKMPAKPTTDNDFATTDAACKALKKAEEALDAAEAGALASITDVEAMRRAVADCRKLARDTRLAAEKLVERRKTEIREQAIAAARSAMDLHIAAVNAEIAPMRLQPQAVDFAGAIKGKRSIDSMQDALDTLLASAKIAADAQGRAIRANVLMFKTATGDDAALHALFADLHQLVHKPADDFVTLVDARIAKHRADVAERERLAAESRAKEIAEAEERARQQERDRMAAEQASKIPQPGAESPVSQQGVGENPLQPQPGLSAFHPSDVAAAREAVATPQAATCATAPSVPRLLPAENEAATLKIGEICSRLGVTVTAAFLSDVLHIKAARTDGRAVLYRESQWPTICAQLRSHIGAVEELYMQQEAA